MRRRARFRQRALQLVVRRRLAELRLRTEGLVARRAADVILAARVLAARRAHVGEAAVAVRLDEDVVALSSFRSRQTIPLSCTICAA